MQEIQNASRRKFLKASAVVAGGLVIAFALPQAKRFFKGDSAGASADQTFTPNAFLHIGNDNQVTVLRGLDWQPGDELIITSDEESALFLPSLHLRDRHG